MNTKKALIVTISVALILLFVAVGMAQAPAGPPKPGPEHQKLAYFVGTWDSGGDMKPSALGPGGKFTYTQNCEWFEGNFAVVCHSEGKSPAGSVKGLSVMGWDPVAKTYTYYSTDTNGRSTFSRGMVEGDTWTWNNETKMNGKPVMVLFTLKQVSPDSATYKFEMGPPGEAMKLMMDGQQTRVK